MRSGAAGPSESFQWIETFTGELTLMSLTTHRYLRMDFKTGALVADSPGPEPNGPEGVRFDWKPIGQPTRVLKPIHSTSTH